MGEDGRPLEDGVLGEGLLAVVLQDQVILDGEIQHQAVLLPVGGNAGYPVQEAEPGRLIEHAHTVYRGVALGALAQARDDFHQLRLSVAVDARDAHDLPRVHLQIQAL